MMTSSNGNIFCVTGPFCGEYTGHRWIPLKGQRLGALMFSLICALNKRLSKQRWCWWRNRAHYDVIIMSWDILHIMYTRAARIWIYPLHVVKVSNNEQTCYICGINYAMLTRHFLLLSFTCRNFPADNILLLNHVDINRSQSSCEAIRWLVLFVMADRVKTIGEWPH